MTRWLMFAAAFAAPLLISRIGAASGHHGPISTPADALRASATVIEGEVTDITYTYDDREGPRTLVTLDDLIVHLGEYGHETVEVPTLGGPLPGGGFIEVSELPSFEYGERYLVFLHEGDWFYSPVVTSHAFRLVHDLSRQTDVLLDQRGAVLLGASSNRLAFSADTATDGSRPDALAPFDPRPVRDEAARLLGRGLSKHAFIEELIRAGGVPAGGGFIPSPVERTRWDIVETSPVPEGDEQPGGGECIVTEGATCSSEGGR